MANNKKDRFNGTQIKFAVGYAPDAIEPTSINTSVATAPVFNHTSHGLKSGDVIYLSGVDYSSASGYFPVKVNDANSFVLIGSNFSFLSSSEVSKVRYHKAEMSGFCDATNINIKSFSVSMEPVTTNCDVVKQEIGTVETGETSMSINWKIDHELHHKLENMGEMQIPTYYQFKGMGSNRVRGFKAFVSAFEYSGEVDSYYSGDITLKHQSLKHDVLLDA